MQLGVEIAIDAGCATFAEVRALPDPRGWDRHPALEAACTRAAPCQVRKRADEFWAEFEFYLSDLIVGVALDAALVSMMANPATLGTTSLTARLAKAGAKARSPRACSTAPPPPLAGRQRPLSPLLPAPQGLGPKLQLALAGLPSSIFAAAQPGQSFTVGQRLASYGVKFLEYGVVGTACGFGGQAIANTAMLTRRALQPNPEEEVVAVPPLARARLRGAPTTQIAALGANAARRLRLQVRTALVWGLFMGASSNTRYQIVVGLERAIESLPLSKRLPVIASAATIVIRFANNIYGGQLAVSWLPPIIDRTPPHPSHPSKRHRDRRW